MNKKNAFIATAQSQRKMGIKMVSNSINVMLVVSNFLEELE